MLNSYFEADRLSRVFDDGRHPTLLYITKQEFGGEKHDRPMHSHDNLCELLLVYRGLGSYVIRNRSFPIQEGDVLFYNQDESHEVCSASNEEIGTYCFAFVGLQFKNLPPNHIIPSDSQPVRASGIRFKFFRQLCEEAYQSLGTGLNGDAFAQCLSTAFCFLHGI